MQRQCSGNDNGDCDIVAGDGTEVAIRDMSLPWYSKPAEEVKELLAPSLSVGGNNDVVERGLSETEVVRRLALYGKNLLKEKKPVRWYHVFARQFADLLILILVIAGILSLLLGEVADSITIAAIVFLNGVLGFIQEWKAENAIKALQKMLSLRCKVIRDGRIVEVDADTLVPGDIVLLETGNNVPADIRLLESTNLKADEASLTGESTPVAKKVGILPEDTPLAERYNMLWMGTSITNGRALGIVVATGMSTEFGRIAQLTGDIERKSTNLQQKLAVLAKKLAVMAVVISVMVTVVGVATGKDILQMFMEGVSLAVAAVPEGLPAVVTIILALGVRKMVKYKALLRHLQAAETLGATSVICTDKTGTLTKNEMTVTTIWSSGDGMFSVTGVGYNPEGCFVRNDKRIDDVSRYRSLMEMLETAVICNSARIDVSSDYGGQWVASGLPTEAALVTVARKAGISDSKLRQSSDIVTEFSFNSNRKRMSVVERKRVDGEDGGGSGSYYISHVKGAPEVILERSKYMLSSDGRTVPLSEAKRTEIKDIYRKMAQEGKRTLAIARKDIAAEASAGGGTGSTIVTEESAEEGLILLGIVGIIDPPRPEVENAIKLAARAGIRVIVVTGDAPDTALSISRQIGIDVNRAVTGAEIESMSDSELGDILASERVIFARTVPEHKLRIVKILQKDRQIVAMTGDGVNDAPALKQADVGISMGIRGTDVAKGAADIVLVDDNFASIVGAIEEGRRQYANIQKFVRYLLSSNIGEVLAIFVNILLGGPLILLPVQILWMNLVTDGMTAVALGLEKAEKNIMHQPPRPIDEPIIDKSGIIMVLAVGTYIAVAALWIFHYYLSGAGTGKLSNSELLLLANTVAFTSIVILEKMNVFNFRALSSPIYTIGFFSNMWLLLALAVTIGLQVCAVYLPILQNALGTVALGVGDWIMIVLISLPIFIIVESYKMIKFGHMP